MIDLSAVRVGEAKGRYFRENFAQGGVDLVQVIPELVTNADAAIAASGRESGAIVLQVGSPSPDFLAQWRAQMKKMRSPALMNWNYELRCTDDGEGVDAGLIDTRLGALGAVPSGSGQRGLFGRGLRDVWLAQGAGRIEGIRAGRFVESWFFPSPGDEPYYFVHVRDQPATDAERASLGVADSGTRVTVPLASHRLPAPGRLRAIASQLVQLRPILEDSSRRLWLELPNQTTEALTYPAPEPDRERPVLFDDEVTVEAGVAARIVVRRSAEPLTAGFSRATRRGGLVVRSGRAAHESTLGSFEGRPGTRHLYGEVFCEAIETTQRRALGSPRPQLVVRVDRSGLNEHHPLVKRLYVAIDRVLRPVVALEERRAEAHAIATTRAVTARDQVGVKALNDVLRAAFEQPGKVASERGATAVDTAPVAPVQTRETTVTETEGESLEPSKQARVQDSLTFKQTPVRLHPGERRTITLVADPTVIRPGTDVEIETDAGLRVTPIRVPLPEPRARGHSTVRLELRARATVSPGARLSVIAAAGSETCELEVLIVRHHGSGWVREIARKSEDQSVEAEFDPETGVVTVYEGRKEFRELERAARRAGYTKRRVAEYVPLRMLEVEAASNAVYHWAAAQILAHKPAEERPSDPAEYGQALQRDAQALRHGAHAKLMQAFLEPEVFEGRVSVVPGKRNVMQLDLLDDQTSS